MAESVWFFRQLFVFVTGGTFLLVAVLGCDSKPQLPSNSASKPLTQQSSTDARDTIALSSEQVDDRDEPAEADSTTARWKRSLLVNPDNVQALFELAIGEAKLGKLEDAIDLLEAIPTGHPEAGIPALGQAADWCMELDRYDDAESKYLLIVKLASDATIAHRKLAELYNRQGRRHEAAEHIQALCRRGDVRESEMHGLVSVSDAVATDMPESHPSSSGSLLIGASGKARVLFTQRGYQAAVSLLKPVVDEPGTPLSVNAFYGRCLAESQQHDAFLAWAANQTSEVEAFAEYWAAWGTYLVDQRKFSEAVGALGAAMRLDSTDVRSIRRMIQAFRALEEPGFEKLWADRLHLSLQVIAANNRIAFTEKPSREDYQSLAENLAQLQRPLESVVWQIYGAIHHKGPEAEIASFHQRYKTLANSDQAFGTPADFLCGIDFSKFPLPERPSSAEAIRDDDVMAEDDSLETKAIPQPRFKEIGSVVGLHHTFRVASKPQTNRFSIYQQMGGGLAVLDYDLDVYPDMYFGQGAADPPEFFSAQSNKLFRNVHDAVQDVTESSGTADSQYSLGVTSGDWNQDGFADLLVGNIGANSLLINNGDGTFKVEATDPLNDLTLVSTSIAMGDVTGDALPDMVEVNFVHDPSIVKRPGIKPDGTIDTLGPLDFQPATDRILINDGKGGRVVKYFDESDHGASTGLGLVIADLDNVASNEVFVGNDSRPDQLWKRSPAGQWNDIGPVSGCAFGQSGACIASMGIAAADYDANGFLDLFITNFQNEPNGMFLSQGSSYQDRAQLLNLSESSLPVLGFGAQALDYSNDGRLDIMVTNGHVENFGNATVPFKQPAHFYANTGSRFELITVADESGYFDQGHVGRALATLDFDRDGKLDFAITHLEEATALLLNQAPDSGHWLQVQLVGIKDERDAIGARVELRVGGKRWTQWVASGNGYLCRNEHIVAFGLGSHDKVESLTVVWPSGERQALSVPFVDRRLLVVQGEPNAFEQD